MITLKQAEEMKLKEILYHKRKEFNTRAFYFLNDRYYINFCDVCDDLDISDELIWIEFLEQYGESTENRKINNLLSQGKVALCRHCYEKAIFINWTKGNDVY